MGQDRMRWERMGQDRTGWGETGWNEMEWDEMGWDGMVRDGVRWMGWYRTYGMGSDGTRLDRAEQRGMRWTGWDVPCPQGRAGVRSPLSTRWLQEEPSSSATCHPWPKWTSGISVFAFPKPSKLSGPDKAGTDIPHGTIPAGTILQCAAHECM